MNGCTDTFATRTRATAAAPELELAKEETTHLMGEVQRQQAEVEEADEVVKEAIAEADERQALADQYREECAADLEWVTPKLVRANQAVLDLKKSDIVFMKAMKKPPASGPLLFFSAGWSGWLLLIGRHRRHSARTFTLTERTPPSPSHLLNAPTNHTPPSLPPQSDW